MAEMSLGHLLVGIRSAVFLMHIMLICRLCCLGRGGARPPSRVASMGRRRAVALVASFVTVADGFAGAHMARHNYVCTSAAVCSAGGRGRASSSSTAVSTVRGVFESEERGDAAQLPTLEHQDDEVWGIIQDEARRQVAGIELIASENFVSRPVLEALGSIMTNKYSEGKPGARYYGGTEHVDRMERLCQRRALSLFNLSAEDWAVNVQPYSGSPANFAAYTALLKPHDRIMGLDLPSGGHLTHGYYNEHRRVSATSIYFESLPYRVDPTTGLIDYAELERTARLFRPKLLIAGASAYPRDWDYRRMREIAAACGAYLMTDMAHISGLVAAGAANNPFEYSDVVTSTTHKSLRGPRSGMIFCRKPLQDAIDFAVFPSLQGGPHNHQIAALAVALKEAAQPSFRQYITQVKANAVAMAEGLERRGHKIVAGGTENHLVLWDVRPHSITGSKVEKLLERCSVSVNKNAVHGDKSAVAPGGVRVGTPAMTTRGLKEQDFEQVAEFLDRGLRLAVKVQDRAGSKKLVDFEKALEGDEEVAKLKSDVEDFALGFPFPS